VLIIPPFKLKNINTLGLSYNSYDGFLKQPILLPLFDYLKINFGKFTLITMYCGVA